MAKAQGPKQVSIWGVPTTVTSWKAPASPTMRLRARLKQSGFAAEELYALTVAPSQHEPAVGVVGLKRTVTTDGEPAKPPTLTAEEEALLARLTKHFGGKHEAGWLTLDLSRDRFAFGRTHLKTELGVA